MDRRLSRVARLLGAFLGTFAGIVAVQFMRLRRMEFLPMHPGFYVNHVVPPTGSSEQGRRLRLVVLGLSNQEIAGELYVSVNSVKTYIRSAYRKIGVTTRPQVVSWCVRHGFPPPND